MSDSQRKTWIRFSCPKHSAFELECLDCQGVPAVAETDRGFELLEAGPAVTTPRLRTWAIQRFLARVYSGHKDPRWKGEAMNDAAYEAFEPVHDEAIRLGKSGVEIRNLRHAHDHGWQAALKWQEEQTNTEANEWPEDAQVLEHDVKPCPFCGGRPLVKISRADHKTLYATCRKYRCGGYKWVELEKWNERALSSPQPNIISIVRKLRAELLTKAVHSCKAQAEVSIVHWGDVLNILERAEWNAKEAAAGGDSEQWFKGSEIAQMARAHQQLIANMTPDEHAEIPEWASFVNFVLSSMEEMATHFTGGDSQPSDCDLHGHNIIPGGQCSGCGRTLEMIEEDSKPKTKGEDE